MTMTPLVTDANAQYAPLACQDKCQDDETSRHDFIHIRHELIWRRRFYALLACSITTLFIALAVGAYKLRTAGSKFSCPILPTGTNHKHVTVPYSPAPVLYVNKLPFGDPEMAKFMGPPRPELDQAWHDLLDATLIRYSEDELMRADNATSVRHKDGGFVGGLGVSHSLHCLKRIKKYLHPEYYYSAREGQVDWDELYMHVDHCLESIRQEVLCSANVNVYTLRWTPHNKFMPAVSVSQPNACVDWDALHEWMKGRAARQDDMVGPPESLFQGQ